MTEAGKMSVSQLLKVGEGEFDQAIREMKVKDLMETISGLQKEMSKEQENFNFLSGELQNRKERNSRQYKQISKDMMASQQRLTLLMNRSMKCFSQQNTQQSGDGSPLKRRNSAKGIKPIIDSASKSTNIHRSKSLHAVNQPTESDSTPPKHHPAVATAAYGPSMNKSHKPIIMRTGLNGNNNNILKTTATTNHINTKSETKGGSEKSHAPLSMGDGHVKEGEGKEWSSVMANTESSGAGNCSVGGGGLYVKRKPGQMSRITTTASVSSSRVLPPSDQQFSSVASTSLPSSSSSSHTPVATVSLSSSSNLPSRSIASTTSSFSNDFLFLKSKPPPNSGTNAMIQSPLQNLRSNEGISKSQTITPQDPNSNPQQEFRGLPSVRLLAQSFGSSTALNVNPSQNTNQRLSGSHTNLLPGKGVVRSSSSVNLSTSKQPNTSNRMFPTKSNTGDLNQQEEPVVYINGKQQLNRVPVNTTQNNGNNTGGPNELELARGRLRANRNLRETTGDTSDVGNSAEVASPVSDFSNYESQSKEQRMLEKVRAGPYIKKKDITSSKPTSNAPAPASSSVTVKSINSASSLATSNMANAAVSPSIKRSSSPPPASSVSLSQNFSLKTATSGPTAATEKYSSSSQKGTSKTLHSDYKNNPTNNSNGIGNNTDTFMANLPPTKPSVTSGRVISTAAVTIRRAKSREELQEIENQTWSNKDSLLKQIQARRRDDYDSPDNGGSNFKAMSKLSQSMPSLLHEDNDLIGDGSKDKPIKSSIIMPEKTHGANTGDGAISDEGDLEDDEDKTSRMNLRDWDPKPVFAELYQVKLMEEIVEDISHQFVSMEGLMEKLPMNKKKATLLKTWKRRFFKAKDGWLYYYETSNRDRPSETIQLMGGIIHDMGQRVLGIDDGRGRYLMVRCPTEKEYGQWKVALESQTADNTKATYVRPALKAAKSTKKNVVIVDLGSSAIRAGILGEQASLPDLFFPSLIALDKDTGKVMAVGEEAMKPEIRQVCQIVYPIRPSNKVDQTIIRPFNIEVQLMEAIFSKVFQDLKIKPDDYWVMISTPQNLGDPIKRGLMETLVDRLNVQGVCMVQQALLSLYSYNATSGIIVDIGHRIEILPIFDGFVIEGGVARCPYGAQKVQESLTVSLLHNNYKFHSTAEQILVRYIMEKSCYVAHDYTQEEEWCQSQPRTMKTSVSLRKFNLPEGAYMSVEHDLSRFKSPEGFFNVDMWEMDYPTLHKLVHQAIQTCPMDNRRHMWRAVFLSGGVTMLPGFPERLERELIKLAPPGVPVEVHAAPQRYHAAYVGACSVALMPQFEEMAISRAEWKKDGGKAFRKWKAPSS